LLAPLMRLLILPFINHLLKPWEIYQSFNRKNNKLISKSYSDIYEAMDTPFRPTPDSGNQTVAAAVDEHVDRERCKQNLIIHNLLEPSDFYDTQPLDKDLQLVKL